ncbi:hypothetical protein [Actinomadura sp. 9N215]|uniref:hypothetical protein n=1 Tax=Actinomadura sp. 9N215 TaxID=3375150 RepID=UPI00378DAD45
MQRDRASIEERAEKRKMLAEKARRILLDLLDDENRQRLKQHNRVEITGSNGGRFLVAVGYSGNVYRLDARGGILQSYCAHPYMMLRDATELPYEVAMISQILAIRADETGFLRVAN